jgi:hypothetical protein
MKVMFVTQQTGLASSMNSGGQLVAGEGLKIYDPLVVGLAPPELTYVDWGVLEPAQNATRDILVENLSAKAAILSMATSKWVPTLAMSYITLEWNYTGTKVSSKTSVPLMLTLRVSPLVENITDFSFDITISGA